MAERKGKPPSELPPDLLRRFEGQGGVPLEVVAELFARIELPPEWWERFWEQAADKDYHCISGRVSNVKTNRDRTTRVTIDSTATGDAPKEGEATPLENYFYGPAEITDDQLAEFKRAQSAKLCVTVCFQVERGRRPISSVDVFECPK